MYDGLPKGTPQLSTNAVAALAYATVVTGMAINSFI